MQVTNYQCPSCTGPLQFVGKSGRLECEYCGSSYTPEEIELQYAEKDAAAEEAFAEAEARPETHWDQTELSEDWGEADMRAYNCPSCGAELICEATTAATFCPYCSNPSIVPGQFAGTVRPEWIIPFRLDEKAAKEALKKHYKGKVFLPKSFAAENRIEQIRGVYVPFWLFDGEADADVQFKATRSHTHRRGDDIITTTEHYLVRRAGSVAFEKIPVDASTKMPDAHMDAIEPFDYSQLTAFSTAYLPGFLANKYDVAVEEAAPRVELRAENTAMGVMTRSASATYQTCTPIGKNIYMNRAKVHYALLPVWMLNTKWNGKDYLFAMNGQTGKLIGDLPVSWGRFWGLFAAIAAGLSAACSLLMLLR